MGVVGCVPACVFREHSTAFSTSIFSGLSNAEAPAKSSANAAVIDEKRMVWDIDRGERACEC